MTHRHEWEVELYDASIQVIVCIGCGEAMPTKEIEARLNATESLSAEDARSLCLWLEGPDGEFIYRGGLKLQDYARRLEDETE